MLGRNVIVEVEGVKQPLLTARLRTHHQTFSMHRTRASRSKRGARLNRVFQHYRPGADIRAPADGKPVCEPSSDVICPPSSSRMCKPVAPTFGYFRFSIADADTAHLT